MFIIQSLRRLYKRITHWINLIIDMFTSTPESSNPLLPSNIIFNAIAISFGSAVISLTCYFCYKKFLPERSSPQSSFDLIKETSSQLTSTISDFSSNIKIFCQTCDSHWQVITSRIVEVSDQLQSIRSGGFVTQIYHIIRHWGRDSFRLYWERQILLLRRDLHATQGYSRDMGHYDASRINGYYELQMRLSRAQMDVEIVAGMWSPFAYMFFFRLVNGTLFFYRYANLSILGVRFRTFWI
jgi:hypothetical protein